MNYKLELYQKKQRYSVSKEDELIDEYKHNISFFMRKKRNEFYAYKPCLSQRYRRTNFYVLNKKSIGRGLFKSSSFNNIFPNKNNNNNSNLLFNDNNTERLFITSNKKVSTKVSSKNNSFETSRNYSPRIKNKINNKYKKLPREKLIYLQLKGIRLKNKINDTLDEINNASIEFNQEINDSKNYDKVFGINKEEKIFKNYKKINEQKQKIQKVFINRINENKSQANLLPRSFQYLDKIGKRIYLQAREYDKYKQEFLHKNPSKKFFQLNSKFYLNKLLGELNELGSDILATKKKFKGEDAIEPKNEKNFFHGLVKENLLGNLSNADYIKEIMQRRNVADSLDNKIEKRLFALKQKSFAMKHKLGKSNAL